MQRNRYTCFIENNFNRAVILHALWFINMAIVSVAQIILNIIPNVIPNIVFNDILEIIPYIIYT